MVQNVIPKLFYSICFQIFSEKCKKGICHLGLLNFFSMLLNTVIHLSFQSLSHLDFLVKGKREHRPSMDKMIFHLPEIYVKKRSSPFSL